MRQFWFPTAVTFLLTLTGVLSLGALADEPVRINPLPAQPIVKGGKRAGMTPTQPKLSDEEALKKAQLDPDNGPKLIDYLKQRTLSDAERGKIAAVIERFGADDFEVRVKATQEIERFGPAAVGPLKAAERNPDPEIAYRASLALKKLETVPHSAVAAAAVRAVVKLKPEGAAAALIGFLPLADDESVAEAIRTALIALAVNNGRAEPALVAALSDPTPLRRAAAYVALTEGGPETERIRIKDAYPQLKKAVLNESDPEAKFTGLWSLTLTTREKEYVPELINLIPKVGRGRIWQIEDLLLQLAGQHPKDGRFLKSPESLARSRDAWLGWWKEKGEKLDLLTFNFKPRILGYTDVIEMDYRGYGQGRIVSYGPDMKEKWRITNVMNPTDMKLTPEGHIYVVESNNNIVSLRMTNGTVIRSHNVYQQPLNLSLLPDGGFVVVCRNNIFEFDKDFKQRWVYQRPNYDIMAGCRLPNGETLFLTNLFQGINAFRLDDKGKEIADATKRHTFGRIQNLHSLDVIGEDKVLVCEFDKVAEYDLNTGKQIWKYTCNAPSSCQRLPNGNTLITLLNQNQVIEVDPSGEVVWDYQAKDGLRVARAYRR
jgi:hypothetical protein